MATLILIHAVYLVEFGKWDYRQWARKPEEKLVEFWKFFEQFVRRQEKDAKANNGQGMVQLVDWDGFALSHHSSPHGENLRKSNYFCSFLCPTAVYVNLLNETEFL